jgi:hypothetical protein
MEDEGRHPQGGQEVADVEVTQPSHHLSGTAWARGEALHVPEPPPVGRVLRGARVDPARDCVGSPTGLGVSEDLLKHLRGPAGGVPVGPQDARRGCIQDEVGDTLGLAGCEECAVAAPLRPTQQRSSLDPSGVHHRSHVVGALLECHGRDPVGQPRPTLVEQDDAESRGEALEEAGVVGLLPIGLQVRDVPGRQYEGGIARAERLVGERYVA